MSEDNAVDTPKPAPEAALKPQKPKARLDTSAEEEKRADRGRQNRRKFVTNMMTGFFVLLLLAFMRFFFPRALFEPKTKFKIGSPSEFDFGVDTRFQSKHRIWVVKNAEGLFVLLAKCTHLGCTPDWKEAENKFKCPCHGSGFTNEGIHFEGPAPRPLDRCHVEINPEGQIVVDTLKLYAYENRTQAGAILRV